MSIGRRAGTKGLNAEALGTGWTAAQSSPLPARPMSRASGRRGMSTASPCSRTPRTVRLRSASTTSRPPRRYALQCHPSVIYTNPEVAGMARPGNHKQKGSTTSARSCRCATPDASSRGKRGRRRSVQVLVTKGQSCHRYPHDRQQPGDHLGRVRAHRDRAAHRGYQRADLPHPTVSRSSARRSLSSKTGPVYGRL